MVDPSLSDSQPCCKTIEIWAGPSGNALLCLDAPNTHGRLKLSVATDFGEAFGHFRPADMVSFAQQILATYAPPTA